jgi:REP element-mobilizing transposase RayT
MKENNSLLSNDIKQILKKCREDACFFISNFCVRPDNINEKINLDARPKQKEIVNSYLSNHFIIINSSRQVGKTTLIEALILWHVLFFPSYSVGILSRSGELTVKIISEIATIYENLPLFFRKMVRYTVDNARTKKFSNYSSIESIIVEKNKPENAGRGCRHGLLFIDECAFIEYMDIVYSSLEPVTSSKHKDCMKLGYPYGIIISSTPNGVEGIGEWYYTMWNLSLDNKTEYKPIQFHWRDAGFTEEEMVKKRERLNDELKYMQEYELYFLSGENSFLDADSSLRLQKGKKDPLYKIKSKDNYTVTMWDKIQSDRQYIVSIDTASETGTSDQALLVAEYTEDGNIRFIGEGYDKIPIISFTDSVVEILNKLFDDKSNYFIIIEHNYLGEAVIDTIRIKYPDMYSKIYTHKAVKKDNTYVITKGIQTTTKTKNLMADALSQYLTMNRDIIDELILPHTLIRQILSLQYNRVSQRLSVPKGMKDDLIMCACFILYLKFFETKEFNEHIARCRMTSDQYVEVLGKVLNMYQTRYGR